MNNQNGFTLIELVVVIVILGILGAIALPRFVNIGSDARIASVKALAGAVDSASDLVHARVLATNATGSSVAIDGGYSVNVANNGYPDATATGIAAALKRTDNFTSTAGTGTYTWQHNGAPTPADCRVTYTLVTGSGASGPPNITYVTSGC